MEHRNSYLAKLVDSTAVLLSGQRIDQCAAVCYRRVATGDTEILLISSLRSGRWVLPKGHINAGESVSDAAAREAFEEAGVIGNTIKSHLGYYTYVKDGDPIPRMVDVQSIEVEGMAEEFPQKDMRSQVWVEVREAASKVDEPELQGLLRKFSNTSQ